MSVDLLVYRLHISAIPLNEPLLLVKRQGSCCYPLSASTHTLLLLNSDVYVEGGRGKGKLLVLLSICRVCGISIWESV